MTVKCEWKKENELQFKVKINSTDSSFSSNVKFEIYAQYCTLSFNCERLDGDICRIVLPECLCDSLYLKDNVEYEFAICVMIDNKVFYPHRSKLIFEKPVEVQPEISVDIIQIASKENEQPSFSIEQSISNEEKLSEEIEIPSQPEPLEVEKPEQHVIQVPSVVEFTDIKSKLMSKTQTLIKEKTKENDVMKKKIKSITSGLKEIAEKNK